MKIASQKLKGKPISFKSAEACCEKMKEAVGEDFLEINNQYDYLEKKEVAGLFIFQFSWDGTNGFVKINFCPFCGEKIEVIGENK